MRARFAVEIFGIKLIGLTVDTPPMGNYPGGRAEVIRIEKQDSELEIAFYVQHPTWKDIMGSSVTAVFDHEDINVFLPETKI
jgi:hypothetical protein